MLIRATSDIGPAFRLMTIGSSCHYVLGETNPVLFDSCLSVQIPLLVKRLAEVGRGPENISTIFLSHLHADRVAGVPYLKKLNPAIRVAASPLMKLKLTDTREIRKIYEEDIAISSLYKNSFNASEIMPFEEFAKGLTIDTALKHGDLLRIDEEIFVRVVAFPGHSSESLAFFVQPYQFLLGDEGLGYFHGTRLVGPGGDESLEKISESISKISNLDILGLCLPHSGVLTGNLVRKLLNETAINISDLYNESFKAHQEQVSVEEIKEAIWESFYKPDVVDHLSIHNAKRTFEAVWNQVLAEIHRRESSQEKEAAN